MTLLVEVMERPLDPGYAAAAERRRAARVSSRPARPDRVFTPASCWRSSALLTVAAVLALRAPAAGGGLGRDALLPGSSRETSAADRLQRANDSLAWPTTRPRPRCCACRPRAPSPTSSRSWAWSPARWPCGARACRDHRGRRAVGPGHRRQRPAPGRLAAAQGRVLDRDLQIVVNGLWAAGAEAISINGQRLTALSAIRSAGEAILVDFRPLSPPYVVSAVGEPTRCRPAFADGPLGAATCGPSVTTTGSARPRSSDAKTLTLPARTRPDPARRPDPRPETERPS